MSKIHFYFHGFLLFTALVLVTSCYGQEESVKVKNNEKITIASEESKDNEENLVKKPKFGFNSGFLDSKGVLWFGSNGGGLYRYDGISFSNFSEIHGLCNNKVNAIIEDKEGDLWLGTGNGLCRYDRKTFTHIPIPFADTSSVWLDKVYPIINPNEVHTLVQDRRGDLWLGTGGAGAYMYDGKDFTSFLSEIGSRYDRFYHNWIPSIAEDKEGNIWFGSMSHGGASRYDGEIFTHFMPEDGLSDDMIRKIYVDNSGIVWFGFNGSRNSGLTTFNGKSFHTFTKDDGICSTSILGIYKDKKGKLWLGSGREDNLCVFDGNDFTEFSSQNGETFAQVLFILEDSFDNVWFGGKHGLWKYDGKIVTDMTKRN